MFQVKNLQYSFGEKQVLSNISFTISTNSVLGVVGASGSGKSTLLKLLSGHLPLQQGTVTLDGEEQYTNPNPLLKGNGSIHLVAQDFELKQHVKAGENLMGRLAAKEKSKAYNSLIRDLELKLDATQKSHEISGGQKQRLAIGKAVADKPKVLLLDEPFSNLDWPVKHTLKQHLTGKWKPKYTVLVAHDPADVLEMCEEVLVLKAGTLVQRGTVSQVYYEPKSKYVAGLFGAYNVLPNDACKALGLPILRANRKNQLVRPNVIGVSREGVPARVKSSKFLGQVYIHQCELQNPKIELFFYSIQAYEKGKQLELSYNGI